MATTATIMILEGASGHAFFFRETLLAQGIAARVDLVGCIEEAMAHLKKPTRYDLIITDLEENWEEGLRIGFECDDCNNPCRFLIFSPPDVEIPDVPRDRFIIRHKPATLREFTQLVREILQQPRQNSIRFTKHSA